MSAIPLRHLPDPRCAWEGRWWASFAAANIIHLLLLLGIIFWALLRLLLLEWGVMAQQAEMEEKKPREPEHNFVMITEVPDEEVVEETNLTGAASTRARDMVKEKLPDKAPNSEGDAPVIAQKSGQLHLAEVPPGAQPRRPSPPSVPTPPTPPSPPVPPEPVENKPEPQEKEEPVEDPQPVEKVPAVRPTLEITEELEPKPDADDPAPAIAKAVEAKPVENPAEEKPEEKPTPEEAQEMVEKKAEPEEKKLAKVTEAKKPTPPKPPRPKKVPQDIFQPIGERAVKSGKRQEKSDSSARLEGNKAFNVLRDKYPAYMARLVRKVDRYLNANAMTRTRSYNAGQVRMAFGIKPDGKLAKLERISVPEDMLAEEAIFRKAMNEAAPFEPLTEEMQKDMKLFNDIGFSIYFY